MSTEDLRRGRKARCDGFQLGIDGLMHDTIDAAAFLLFCADRRNEEAVADREAAIVKLKHSFRIAREVLKAIAAITSNQPLHFSDSFVDLDLCILKWTTRLFHSWSLPLPRFKSAWMLLIARRSDGD